MEKSISQDNPVVNPYKQSPIGDRLRKAADAPSLIDMSYLQEEYDKRHETNSAPPVYDLRNTWLKDAWNSTLNERDTINIMTQRGKLAKDIYPSLNAINDELQSINLQKERSNVSAELEKSAPGSAEFIHNLSKLRDIDNQLQKHSNYDAVAAGEMGKNLDARVADLTTRKTKLEEEAKALTDSVADYQKDLKERQEEYQISNYHEEQAKLQQQEGKILTADYWKYAVPSLLGSSISSWKSQAATLGLGSAVSALGAAGIVTGGTSTAVAAGLVVAANLASSVYQRDQESLAEVFGAKKSKVLSELESKGIQQEAITELARQTLRNQGDENVDDIPSEELVDRVVSGEIRLNDAEIDKTIAETTKGLQTVYNNNMMLSASDFIQMGMRFAPIGGAIKRVSDATIGRVAKATKRAIDATEVGAKATARLGKIPAAFTDLSLKLNKTRKGVISGKIGKFLGKTAFDASMEAAEEGVQNLYSNEYQKKAEESSIIGSLLGTIPAYATVASIATGINTKHELANDPEFWQSLQGGAAIGLVMGGVTGAYSTTKDIRRQMIANNHVNNIVANNIAKKDAFLKATTYVNKAANGKKDEVLLALNTLKQNLPDGVTEEDIDTEIKHAKQTFAQSEHPANIKLGRELGYSKSSDEYAKLIGLQMHNLDKIEELMKSGEELHKAYNEVFPTEGGTTVKSLLNAVVAVDQLLETPGALSENVIKGIRKQRAGILDILQQQEGIADMFETENGVTLPKPNALLKSQVDYDAVNTYKALALNNAALDVATEELNLVSGLSDEKDRKKAKETIHNYVMGIAAGQAENAELVEAARKEDEKTTATATLKAAEELDREATIDVAAKNESHDTTQADPSTKEKATSKRDAKLKEATQTPIPDEADLLVEDKPQIKTKEEADAYLKGANEKTTEEPKDDSKIQRPKLEEKADTTNKPSTGADSVLPPADDDFLFADFDNPQEDLGYTSDGELMTSSANKAENKGSANPPLTNAANATGSKHGQTTFTDWAISMASAIKGYSGFDESERAVIDAVMNSTSTQSKTDLLSNVMFFKPDSNTPMSITVNGVKLDVESGEALSKVIDNPDFMSTSKFEYVVADWQAGKPIYNDMEATWGNAVEHADIYVLISYNGKQYATAFRQPKGAATFYSDRLKSLLTKVPEELRGTFTDFMITYFQQSVEKLKANRLEIIKAFNTKSKDEIIIPVNIFKSVGEFDINAEGIRRSALEVTGFGLVAPEEMNLSNTTIGIGRGTYSEYQVVNPLDNTVMPNKGGNGDVFIYPPTSTGEKKAVLLDKIGVGDREGLSDIIFSALTQILSPSFTHNGVNCGVNPLEFLSFICNFGSHTAYNPESNLSPSFMINKQFYFDSRTKMLHYGTKSTPLHMLHENAEGIMDFLENNVNIRFSIDPTGDTINLDAPVGSVVSFNKYFEANPNAQEWNIAEGITITREDANAKDSMTTLGWMFKQGLLETDLNDGVFRNSFHRAEGVSKVPKPGEPAEVSTVTPKAKAKSKSKKKITDARVLGVFNPSEETSVKIQDIGIHDSDAPKKAKKEAKTTSKSTKVTKDTKAASTEKPKKPFDLFSEEDGAFSYGKVSGKRVSNKEMQWLRKSVGLTDENIIVTDIPIAAARDGMQALGQMWLDTIKIASYAQRGTAYHEGFHRVSLLMLSESERNQIYEMMAKRLGITTNTILEQKTIEEHLANDFASFMVSKFKHSLYPVTKFFRRLWSFVTTFSTKTPFQLSDLYNEIANGKFANYKPNPESVERFKSLYSSGYAPFTIKGYKFKHINLSDYNEIVNSLVAALFRVNKIEMAADLSNLDLDVLYRFLDPENTELFDLTDQQKATRNEIYENLDNIFLPELKQKLADYAIRLVDKQEASDELADALSNGEEVANDISNHVKMNIEISWKDNAMTAAKLFVATIKATDTKGVPLINAATGLPVFVDFNLSWNKVLNGLHTATTFDQLKSETARLSKIDNFFAQMNDKLNKIKSEFVQTQLLNTISTAYHNMEDVLVTTKESENGTETRVYVHDSNVKRATRELPIMWNGLFLQNMYKVEGSIYSPNTEVFKRLKERVALLNTAAKTVDNNNVGIYRSMLLGVLKQIGVDIDDNVLSTYISTYNQEDPSTAFKMAWDSVNGFNLLFNTIIDLGYSTANNPYKYMGKVVEPTRIHERLDILKNLARLYATLNPNPSELTVIGVDNTLLYPISSHNYLSSHTQELNANRNAVVAACGVTYNMGKGGKKGTGSMALRQMLKGAKLKVHTFVGFKVDDRSDTGRKYTGIEPVEDYTAKMALTQAGHLLMPTMGDSSMYNTISGIRMFSKQGAFYMVDGKPKYHFSTEIVDQMWEYFKAEFETIKTNYANEKYLEKHPELKVTNYHTGTRNGYRFRYFNEIPLNGKHNLDTLLIEAEQKDGDNLERPHVKAVLNRISELITKAEKEGTRQWMINETLNPLLKAEYKYVEELGVIFDSSVINQRLETLVYQNVKPETAAKIDILAVHFANTIASIIECEKLFMKDPAYYSWKQANGEFTDKVKDKIKRLREVLSTGVQPRTDIVEGTDFDKATDFNVAVFNDNFIADDYFQEIENKARYSYIVNLLNEMHGISDDKAMVTANDPNALENYPDVIDAANRLTEGFQEYKEANQTNATCLISPEMFKQLVKRVDGWSPELEEAFNLLNDPNSNWETNSEAYMTALALTLKPLKFVYFGGHIDNVLKLEVPVFDKMALFPVHRVFATGDMKRILELMEDPNKPIHMIPFDSAVKVGLRNSMDMFKTENGENIINPELGNIAVYKQQFKNLRRQLLTDPHHSDRQMFVTQGQKAAMGNIRNNRIYTLSSGKEVSGKDLKKIVKQSLDALTKKGYKSITKRLGVTTTTSPDGEIEFSVDKNKLYDVLLEKATNSNANTNILTALSKQDGKSRAPLSSMSDNNWVETSLSSLLKREVIDTNLPGGMFIQMSSVMYNKTTDKNDIRKLRIDNPDGSMDCVISLNLLKHILPRKDMTYAEAKKWLMDNDVIGYGENVKPLAMGYRIPAQGQSSLAALRIVDLWPEQIGDTITLPDSFTAQTGSDFD